MGLRKSTPTNFILAETKEPPFFLRSKFLCNNFISRVYTQTDHPIIPTLNKLQNLLEDPTQVDCVGSSFILDSYMEVSHLSLFIDSKSRPLCYNFPYSSLIFSPETNLVDGVNKSVNGQRLFCEIFKKERATSYCLFTDGSRKDDLDHSGFSVVSEDGSLVRKYRSLGFVSIFTLEAMAILCTVKEIERIEDERFIIFSDSKSVIVALANAKLSGRTSFLILEIKHCVANLLKVRKRIKFIWIPSHCGIVGNERADLAAKEAICNGIDSTLNVSSRDLRIKWSKNLFSSFFDWCKVSGANKASWYMDNCLTNSRRTWFHGVDIPRRSVVSICRLRSGHTSLLASLHRFRIVPSPTCLVCDEEESANHIFWKCTRFKSQRKILIESLIGFGKTFPLSIELLLSQLDGDMEVISLLYKFIISIDISI